MDTSEDVDQLLDPSDIEGPLEPVEYLARSPSRVGILDTLRQDPRTWDELKGLTEVSRFTLSRTSPSSRTATGSSAPAGTTN